MEDQIINQSPRSIVPAIIVLLVAAIAVGGGAYWWKSTHIVEPVITTQVAEAATIEEGYTYESNEWTHLIEDIKEHAGEVLSSLGAPSSPTNKDTIFVSTNSNTTGTSFENMQVTSKIYSFNIKTHEIGKLFEEHEARELRTMGIEGTKLILMVDEIDNSPGPCFSVWANWGKFAYLDITNPSAGLKPYSIPNSQVEKGKDEQKKCQAEFDLDTTPSINAISTVDWTTYHNRNKENGFTLKLPRTWSLVTQPPDGFWLNPDVPGPRDDFYAPTKLSIRDNKDKLSIADWFVKNYPKNKTDLKNFNPISVSGSEEALVWNNTYYIKKGTKIFEFSLMDISENVVLENEMLKKIVSTFNLTQ